MIDATTFASSYNAFWNEIAPTSEHFMRRQNLELERFAVPMDEVKTRRRAVIAEYAFSIFYESWLSKNTKKSQEQLTADAWKQTVRRLKPFLEQNLDLSIPSDADEKKEVSEIFQRLSNFFVKEHSPQQIRPIFKGCGFVDASEADVLAASTLFEVKTVERSFRSADLRQAITYAALNHSSKEVEISKLGLINPRRGVFFEIPLNEISMEISGRTADELLSTIVQTISSGEISR